MKILQYIFKALWIILICIFPGLIGFPIMIILQGDYNFKPNTRLIISIVGLIILIGWCSFITIQRLYQGEIRSIRQFFLKKPSKDTLLILGTYVFVLVPTTILYVHRGEYSIIYAAMLNAVCLINIWIGIKLIRYESDFLSILTVVGWTITGLVIHSFIIYIIRVMYFYEL